MTGEELLKQRVRVSFDFDCICNTGPIINSIKDDDVKAHDLALLKSFLAADKDKPLMMMVDKIGAELGYHPDAFMEDFLPQVSVEPHELFKSAIDQLEGTEATLWREVQDEPRDPKYGDVLSLCTEGIFETFEATFISSSFEVRDTHE